MKFYTDGSRVGNVENFVIGWSAVCEKGVIISNSKIGGSNINAEMFAIRDLLKYLSNKQVKLLANEEIVDIVTDSKTSIQIITGYMKSPNEYDLNESDNYKAAHDISGYINTLKEMGKTVLFTHVRGHGKDDTMDKIDIWGNMFADYVATQESRILFNKTNNI